jgi:hypothetical protein
LGSAKITAIFYFIPIFLPLLSPAKRPVADNTDLLWEIPLADVFSLFILHG